MPNSIPLVRARYLARFCDALRRRHIDPSPYLVSEKLAHGVLSNPEAWIPLSQLMRFLEAAVHDTGYLTLGLDAGITPRKQHSKFTKIVLYSPTLFQSLRGICANSAMEDTSANFRLIREPSLGWLDCRTIHESEEAIRQLETYRYAALLEIIRMAAGPEWLPPCIHFSAPENSSIRDAPLLRDVETHFSRQGLRIAIESRHLSHSIADVPELPTTQPEFHEAPVEFLLALREVTRSLILAHKTRIQDLALALQMSPRTLQRRLGEYEVSFSKLQTHVRIDTAKSWLENLDWAISVIASKLAYAHSTHFSRAFAKVCGVTPREYRQLHQPKLEGVNELN